MTKEQAELVYKAVANGKQVNPLAVNSRVDELSKVVNPYTVGLRTNTDSTLKKEPSSEMKKYDLTFQTCYILDCDSLPCMDYLYHFQCNLPLYSIWTNVKDLITDEQSDLLE